MTDDPWYITALSVGILFGLLGAFIMTVMPHGWQNPQGWMLVSFVGLPGFFVILAVLINFPGLLFGALFVAGIMAMNR